MIDFVKLLFQSECPQKNYHINDKELYINMASLYSLICRKTLQNFFNKAFICKSVFKYSDLYEDYSNIWFKYVGKDQNLDFENITKSNKVISHTKYINNTINKLRELYESDFFNHLSIITSMYCWDEKIKNYIVQGFIEALFIDNNTGNLAIFRVKDFLFEETLLHKILVYDFVPSIILKSSKLKKNIITYLYDPIDGKIEVITPNYKRLSENYEYIINIIKGYDSRIFVPYMEKDKCKSCLCRKQCFFSLAKNIEGVPLIKVNHQFIEDLLF